MAKETKAFQAEVKEILDLMVHSIYSQKEIFLRELISNSSDALDRLRFEELSNNELKTSGAEKHIRLIPNKSEKTLTILDNGIGMSSEDIIENLGTIARSGTKQFLKAAKEIKNTPELIGQFGVGFYSSFMVADKVSVHSQKATGEEGILWESTGDGTYSIDSKVRPEGNGTTIVLHLKKPDDKEENPQDFTDIWTLKSIVKKYSDFIEFPIQMNVEKEEPELDGEGKPIEGKTKKIIEDEVLNSRKAIWLRSSSEIKPEEYSQFYKHLSHDWTDPEEVIHYKAEGTQEFSALMFIPSKIPFDYNQRETKIGLNLYVKKIFIMENCEDLLPTFLRFVKGIVDSSDLPLNVSREILQKDHQIQLIRKGLVSKILKHLQSLLSKNRTQYEKIWNNFGATLKEGVAQDTANKSKIEDLLLFKSNKQDHLTSLKEYISRMKSDQKEIYYISGESLEILKDSPYLEKLNKKDLEVLFLTDPVDEWVSNSINEYDSKKLISITSEDLNIDTEEEKKKNEEELKSKAEQLKPLTESIKVALDEFVKEVKVSDRLVDTPVCLVSSQQDPSARMERIMESMGQALPKSKRILEINPNHPVIEKMSTFESSTQKEWAEILFNQALLNEGSPIKDPMKFSKQISGLMTTPPR